MISDDLGWTLERLYVLGPMPSTSRRATLHLARLPNGIADVAGQAPADDTIFAPG